MKSGAVVEFLRFEEIYKEKAIAHCLWKPEESQVESYKHQNNANIHHQPFPESVSEKH